MVAFALDHGADWLILQPPSGDIYDGDVYVDFFIRVADGYEANFSVQYAPNYLGTALNIKNIERLMQLNRHFLLIKCETSAVVLADLVIRCGDILTVFNGRGGLELTDCLRAGAAGFIVAPDVIDYNKAIFDLWMRDDKATADSIYSFILPSIVFMMQSIEHMLCYGKRIYGLRSGTVIFDRSPCLLPSDFGISLTEHWARVLGAFSDQSKG